MRIIKKNETYHGSNQSYFVLFAFTYVSNSQISNPQNATFSLRMFKKKKKKKKNREIKSQNETINLRRRVHLL